MKKNAIFWYDLSKLSLSLQSIPLPKAHKKAGGQGDIYILRRNWTLWFWRVRTSQLQTECQEQSNGDALQGVLYTVLFGFEQILVGREEELYTHLRGAFSVVSFRHSGQCEDLNTWNERQDWLHVFYVYAKININCQYWSRWLIIESHGCNAFFDSNILT